MPSIFLDERGIDEGVEAKLGFSSLELLLDLRPLDLLDPT